MYRDDLEAALARNSILERELRELRQSLAPPGPDVRPVPRARRVVYVRPVRYFPAFAAFASWFWLAAGSLRDQLTIETPAWWKSRSDILVLDLLRWPLILLSMPVVMLLQLVLVIAYGSFLVIAFPILGLATIAISVVGLPVIAAASIRRWRSGGPSGLRWGTEISPEAARVYAASVLCLVVALVPLVLLLVL